MTDAIRDRIATLAHNYTPRIAAERIRDQFIVVDREELPLMTAGAHGNYLVIEGQKFSVPDCDPQKLRQIAGGLFVYAEQIEDDEAAKNKRRDELALEFTADTRGTLSGACNYAGLLPWTRKMVDRIIELEQAQS